MTLRVPISIGPDSFSAAQKLACWRAEPDISATWRACRRGDWMFTLVLHALSLRPDPAFHRRVITVAIDLAELTNPIWKRHLPDDPLLEDAVHTARRWMAAEISTPEITEHWDACRQKALSLCTGFTVTPQIAASYGNLILGCLHPETLESFPLSVARVHRYANPNDEPWRHELTAFSIEADIIRTEWPDPPEIAP